MLRGFVVFAVLLVLVVPVTEAGILHFEDLDLGTSAVPGALTMLGLAGDTTFTSSSATFETLLTTGGPWDLVIFGEQNGTPYGGSVQTAVLSYISGGGKVLATTWLSGPLLGDFDAVGLGANASPITADGSPFFAGLPPAIGLTNPGWGTYSTSLTPSGGGTGFGGLGGGFAGVIGNDGRTIVQGPLFDTFSNLSEGELFVANEIGFLISPAAVPEPGTMVLFGLGLAAVGLVHVRRRRKKSV